MKTKKLNNRIGELFQILFLGLIFGAGMLPVCGQANRSAAIFDGRSEPKTTSEITKQEERFIEKEVRNKESVIKGKSKLDCDEDTFSINSAVSGSFTRSKSSQKAFLYELCRSGRSFGIGGIIVVENGSVAAHYTYGHNGLSSEIASAPDINQNGLSEILLIGGGTGQGYTEGVVEIIEIASNGVKSFGIADTYSDNYGTDNPKTLATAYKVSAQPGKTPVYFRDTYNQKGSEEKWTPVKKSQKFSLRKDYAPKYNKIP